MKNSLLVTVAVCVALTGAAQAQTIKIATEGAYKPYNFKDAAGNLVGFEVDLASELCTRMEADCTLVEQAWDGMIPSLLAKKYDAIMAGMSVKPEREEVISFSRQYTTTPIQFAVPADSELATMSMDLGSITLDDVDEAEQAALEGIAAALSGKTVGVQASTTHELFMTQYMAAIDLKSYDTMDNMILDLQAGRIDAGFTAVTFLQPIIEDSSDIAIVGPGIFGGPLGAGVAVGVRQEDNELRENFSAAIQSMMDDGSLKALTIEWFGFDATVPD